MNYFLFDHSIYDRLYSCSLLSEAEWESKKRPNLVGVVHITLATIYQSLYLIFLAAMLQKKFWACSCYKLMFALGVYDVCATFIGGTFCGILSIRGDVFCTNPTFVYLVGCLQASLWSGACITGLILLVNRVLDLANEAAASYFFAGSRTYIWFIFPFASFLYMWFYTTPFLFNAILDAAFLNPFSGIPEIQIDILQYDNFYCRIHNYIIAAIYPFIYLVICVILWKKSKRGAIGSKQKQIVIQSIIVSALLAITAVTYMIMQYIPTPTIMPIIVHFLWQASHGASVFTYIFVNKSMRKQAIWILKNLILRIRCGFRVEAAPYLSFSTQNKPLSTADRRT